MSNEDMAWTGPWVADKLARHDKVAETKLIEPQVVKVARTKHDTVLVATLAAACVDASTIQPLVTPKRQLSFFVNIPKEAFWLGEAINLVESQSAAFGGVSDLYRAINDPLVGNYQRPEYAFFERNMRQHDNVESIDRLHDRRYLVNTRDRRVVDVVLLNEYELVAEKVRTSWDNYGGFQAVLITNPNGKATSEAKTAARTLGVRIFKLAKFMGFLKRRS